MFRGLVILGLLGHSGLALAQMPSDIRRIEGIYRATQQNGDSSGAKYKTTDVLRILGHTGDSVYFDLGLNFYNGHTCYIAGIARREKSEFVYRKTFTFARETEKCELRMKPGKKEITFDDIGGHCRSTCGARGGYNGAAFRTSLRKAFPKAEAFRKSATFEAALTEYRTENPQLK